MQDNQNKERSALLSGEPLGPARTRTSTDRPAASPRKKTGGGKPTGPMKQLTDAQVKRALEYAATAYDPPEPAFLKVALSIGAGLRASEIAKLRMRHVTDAEGNIADVIRLSKDVVAKNGQPREIPMDSVIRQALVAYRKRFPGVEHLATAYRGAKPQNASCVTSWFWNFYRRLHLKQCASHSGRKTFITNLAKVAPTVGMTLRDVQELAGHARLSTTQVYIAISPNHDKLINAVSPSRLLQGAEGER